MHRSSPYRNRDRFNMTTFRHRTLETIRHVGGVFYYTDKEPAKDGKGNPLVVLNADDRTLGIVGWPTVNALLVNNKIRHVEGSKYELGKSSE